MASASNFTDFIQACDAAGLRVFMTNEQHLPVDHLERNNRALFQACRDGAEEICEVLISFGADVNSVDVNQQTHLFIACKNAHPACVDLLLAHGVNVNAGDLNDGETPLMVTAREDDTPNGLTLDQFIDNRCRCMSSLIAAGAVIDQTDVHDRTALIGATWNFRLMEILVEAGANLNLLDTDQDSALHYASEKNNVVELLLENGVDIDAVNVDGETPMHLACYNLNPSVVVLFLRHNADIDMLNNDDRTALQVAMSSHTSPNRVDVQQLIATYAQMRLEESLADWIRLERNERLSQH